MTYYTYSTINAVEPKQSDPVLWRGWNRTCGFLIDAEITNRNSGITLDNILVRQTRNNINKVEIAGFAADNYQKTPARVQVFQVLETPSGEPFTGVWCRNNTQSTDLTEKLYYENRNECRNPIMLDWINSLGGVDQWLFSINQTVSRTVNEGVLIEIPVQTDIEGVTRTKQRFPGSTFQRILLTAEKVTTDQLNALFEIKETDSLRVYLTKDGTEFIDAVIVNDFVTAWQSQNDLHDYTIEIEFPDDFDFYKAKKY